MTKKLKILIVEDVDTDEELIRIELSNASIQFESKRVDDKEKYIELLHSFSPDAIISDFSLPQFNGMEALKIRNNFNKDIPFILATGAQTEEVAVNCIHEGADDYILKSSLTRLPTALLNALQKKKAERETKRAVERTLFISEAMPQKVWTAKADGNLNYFNKLWIEYTGLNYEDLSGWGWEKIIHPDDWEENKKIWQNAVDSGTNFQLEHRLRNKNGEYRWHLARGIVQKDEKGKVLMWVGTDTDIQEMKIFQESLAKSREQLQVMNDEFRVKNEQLMKTNNDLDNFVYTASHDLKAPISNIEGLISSLDGSICNETIEKEEIEIVIDMIKASINRFKYTIQDLTEISKVQKESKIDIANINFDEAIEDALFSIDKQLKEIANIHIDVSACPLINFSKKDLKSILYNLISNALKYRSPDRSPEIYVKTEKIKNYILLSVRDNGLGIPQNNIYKIFTMFKRLHNHVEGSGIGLYLVKRIVDNTDGKIEVESEVGKGTHFKIFLKDQYFQNSRIHNS